MELQTLELSNIKKPYVKRRRIVCPHCKEQFKFDFQSDEMKAPRIVDKELTEKEKRRIYVKRYIDKKINNALTIENRKDQ